MTPHAKISVIYKVDLIYTTLSSYNWEHKKAKFVDEIPLCSLVLVILFWLWFHQWDTFVLKTTFCNFCVNVDEVYFRPPIKFCTILWYGTFYLSLYVITVYWGKALIMCFIQKPNWNRKLLFHGITVQKPLEPFGSGLDSFMVRFGSV